MNHIEMMRLAEQVAKQSVCKRAKVGAYVQWSTGRVTHGWNFDTKSNGGCCEGADGKTLPTVVHAEAFAISRAELEWGDGVLYVTRQPCIHCAQLITAAGIKSVYYRDKDDKDWGLRWLAWHGVQVDSGWILGQVQDSWAERNGVAG